MSGLMPTFSAIHLLSAGSHTPDDGAVTTPPSISGGEPARPTSPPHVLLPISLPTPARRKYHGIASPPDPANSLINITFGPKIAPCGSTSSPPSRVATLDSSLRDRNSTMSVASAPPPLKRSSTITACLSTCAKKYRVKFVNPPNAVSGRYTYATRPPVI